MMIFGLLAFGTFVTEYGILRVSRGQARSSADAAAYSMSQADGVRGASPMFDGGQFDTNAAFGQVVMLVR